ncbi:hypothetical protein HYV30_02570 [Candidatus Kaiserbacteria bacterium]|nr:hypothetical protein [Candidatus Kaiserbacteria bacterium]
MKRMPREIPKSFLLIILLALLAANLFLAGMFSASTRIVEFAAGKGKAALLQTGSGATLLIDTGADASILRAMGESLPPWRRRLDAVVLTGAPSGGLSAVLERYSVENIIRFGTREMPYGARLKIDDSIAEIDGPGKFSIK